MISTGQVNLSNKFCKSSSVKAFYILNIHLLPQTQDCLLWKYSVQSLKVHSYMIILEINLKLHLSRLTKAICVKNIMNI